MIDAQSGCIELSAEEVDKLRRIAAAPEDLAQLMDIAGVTREAFLDFMNQAGLWEDPEYAPIAEQVLSILDQRDNNKKNPNANSESMACPPGSSARLPVPPVVAIGVFHELLGKLRFSQTALIMGGAAIVVALISIGLWLMLGTNGRLIETADHGSTAHLADRGVLSVGAHSRVRLNDQQYVAYVEAGEVTFDVPSGPVVVETIAAKASVPENARFRVAVTSSVVAFEVYAGVVLVQDRGAKPEMPARRLQAGDTYRAPVNTMAFLVAQSVDPVSVRIKG
jgi:hypothetical protein